MLAVSNYWSTLRETVKTLELSQRMQTTAVSTIYWWDLKRDALPLQLQLGPLNALGMVFLSNDSLWNSALSFLGDYYQDAEVSEAVREGLLRWERLPTELGLAQLMAKLTVPQRSPQFIWGVPEYVIRLGDIGIAGWRSMAWCSLMSQHSGENSLLWHYYNLYLGIK